MVPWIGADDILRICNHFRQRLRDSGQSAVFVFRLVVGQLCQAFHITADSIEKPRGDIFLGQARFEQRAEGTELVERMQRDAHDVFGE